MEKSRLAMGFMGGILARWILNAIASPEKSILGSRKSFHESKTRSNLKTRFGDTLTDQCQGKAVLDFGCGFGVQSVDVAKLGASRTIRVDIQASRLCLASLGNGIPTRVNVT